MASKLAPDYKETLQKFATDSQYTGPVLGDDPNSLESKVKAYAKGMATTNYDVAAWLFVREQNKTPPPMKISSAPFEIIEKPYLKLSEAQMKTLGENKGFNIRGYVLAKRNFTVRSSGKQGCSILITDISDLRDIVFFGDQVEKIDQLLPQNFEKGQAIKITNVQCKYQKADPTKWGLSVSGYYSETSKIGDTDLDLPGKAAIASMTATKTTKDLKQQEVALIRVRALTAENKPYVGCPSCKKKISGEIMAGRATICPSDKSACAGTQVTAINVDRPRVKAFDDAGEVALSFGFGESFIPFSKLQELAATKALLMVAGQLNDSGEFDVSFVMPASTTQIMTITPAQVQPMSQVIPNFNPNGASSVTVTSNPPNMTVSTTVSTPPKAPTVAPIDAALRSLRVLQPIARDEFIKGFLVAKKGMSLTDAQQVVMDLMEAGKATLDGDNLRLA
jgi:hypothetical protein